MIAELIVVGGLYWLYKDKEKDKEDGGGGDAKPEDTPSEPMNPPKPLTPEGDNYRVKEVAKGDQNNIYLLESRFGVLYDDGSGGYTWQQSGYLRGDFPTGFVSAPTGLAGTFTFEINETLYENVVVYATEQEAIDADKLAEPSPDDPQKQPEAPEDDGDDTPSLPPINPPWQGGLGGGGLGSAGSYFGGGY
jgi:hypothetical protein